MIQSKSTDSTLFSTRLTKNFSKASTVKCEASGCDRKSFAKIAVAVGTLGTIDLNMCKSCIPKFNDDKNTRTINGNSHRLLPPNGKRGNSYEYIQRTSI
jgi:hypothetical protein